MRILLDVTRTLVHSRKTTPTGIDRVEHAYIRFLLNDDRQGDNWFIANTPYGRGALSSDEMRRIFDRIETKHLDVAVSHRDTVMEAVTLALEKPISDDQVTPLVIKGSQQKNKDSVGSVALAFAKGLRRFRRLMADRVPSVYLHTSHLQLDEPNCFRWLSQPQLFPVFFIHDLIPIEFPEFCASGAAERHKIRINTALTHARAVLVNSNFTRNSLVRYAGLEHLPPTQVAPLANSIRSYSKVSPPPLRAGQPFFLHVGTIEGRKNIGHLLTVWRHMLRLHGPKQTPRLVLVGRRGWECETVTSTLDRTVELANHVIEVSDVNDVGLSTLMHHASGLLTVSMTEGYGLPPVEAARIGLPVIASDIEAHREILGGAGDFVAIHDGEALSQKIMSLANEDRRAMPSVTLDTYTWEQHVGDALAFINREASSSSVCRR